MRVTISLFVLAAILFVASFAVVRQAEPTILLKLDDHGVYDGVSCFYATPPRPALNVAQALIQLLAPTIGLALMAVALSFVGDYFERRFIRALEKCGAADFFDTEDT